MGCPRRRSDHVQRAVDRHHPDHASRGGRGDHHPVRLSDVREPRAGQDGLPWSTQPHGAGRRHRQYRDEPLSGHRPRRPVQRPHRPSHLRSALCWRHPRGLSVRRWADAAITAVDAARQLRRHLGCGSAVSARTHGRQQPHQLCVAQKRSPGRQLSAPRAGPGSGVHPRHDLRPDRVSGTGHGDRSEVSRLHPRES